jgi:hypothetical protein
VALDILKLDDDDEKLLGPVHLNVNFPDNDLIEAAMLKV